MGTTETFIELSHPGRHPLHVRLSLVRPWEPLSPDPFDLLGINATCLGAYSNQKAHELIDLWALPRTVDLNAIDLLTAGAGRTRAGLLDREVKESEGGRVGWMQLVPNRSPEDKWQTICCYTSGYHHIFVRYQGGEASESPAALYAAMEATPEAEGPVERFSHLDCAGWGFRLPESWLPLPGRREFYSPLGDPARMGICVEYVSKGAVTSVADAIRGGLTLENDRLTYLGAPLISPEADDRFVARTFFHSKGRIDDASIEVSVMCHDIGSDWIVVTGIAPSMTAEGFDWARSKKAFETVCRSLTPPIAHTATPP